MQRSLVMTIIGGDRPGLVELVANLVAEHGGNWLESRMSHLGGQFAGILRVDVQPDREPGLVAALNGLKDQGLAVVVHAESASPATGAGRPASLEIVGQDRPGIVQQISHSLAAHGINVEELNTECTSAPMTGELLFKAVANLQLPPQCDLQALKTELEKIAGDLMVNFKLNESPDQTRT